MPKGSLMSLELGRGTVLNSLRGSITLDTSAIIQYLMGTELGSIIKEYFETLKPEEKVYCSLYSISEIFYLLCRSKGLKHGVEKMNAMLSSRVFEINSTEEMALEAGRLKCERTIPMGSCSCIATATITRSRAVFAQKEKALVEELEREPFTVEVLFLTELKKVER